MPPGSIPRSIAALLRMLAAILLCALAARSHAVEPRKRYAVLVGANDGGAYRVALRFAHDDARQLAGVLSDLGGVGPAERRLLFDPSVARLDVVFDELEASLREAGDDRTEVIFYYSGHADDQGLLLGAERYGYADLRARLEALPATVRIGILDACASGSMVRAKGGRPVTPFLVDTSRHVEGTAFITSSAADEVSQEADRIAGSYFTHYLVSGLRGAADTTGDGRVTLHEAYHHAFTETLARTSQSQHGPQHASYDFQLSGTGDVVLTDLKRTTAALYLDEEVEGSLLVRDSTGRIAVEVSKHFATPLRLGLAPGRYTLIFSRDGRYAERIAELRAGETAEVGAADLEWHDGELAVARGGEPAFVWRRAGVRFQILPSAQSQEVSDKVTLSLIAGRSGRLQGSAFALGANVVDRDANGALFALGGNYVGGDLRGLQVSGLYNHVRGDAGYQLGLGANVVEGNLRGLQIGLGANVLGGGGAGLQAALGANIADQRLVGAQLALGANIATRSFQGAQLAMGANIAGGVSGAQVALVNVGTKVDGLQLGLINVGGTVTGVQLGLINVADEVRGAPIGLVSVSKNGRIDPMVYGDETAPLNLDMKLGNRWLYTWFGGGGMPQQHGWIGGGLGTQLIHRPVFVDFDLGAQWVLPWPMPVGTWPNTSVARARLTLGLPLAEQLAVVVGVNVKARWWGGAEPTRVAPRWIDADNRVVLWPGFHAGLQF